MLHFYSPVCVDSSSSGLLDLYFLYTRFIEKKQELFIIEKEGGDLDKMTRVRREKQLLLKNLGFY